MVESAPKKPTFISRVWRFLIFFRKIRQHVLSLERNLQKCEGNIDSQELRIHILERDHAASVVWLNKIYPEVVEAINARVGEDRLNNSMQDILSVIHRETGKLSSRLTQTEQASVYAAGNTAGPLRQVGDSGRIDAFYLELERRFRGTERDIAARVRHYLPFVLGSEVNSPVLDLGCGRGEWLAAVKEEGLDASGVDLSPINADYCRLKKLQVVAGDAIGHLAGLAENSIGTISAFQLVEHLPFAELLKLTDEILRVLKPGGMLIYETPNPENLLVATQSFWVDPTHVHPLPPALLEFLVMQAGLVDIQVHRLHPDLSKKAADETLTELLSCSRDYAVVARKPHAI